MGTSESRPHSACNVETQDPKSATAQIGGRGKGCTDHFGVGNSSQRDERGKQLHHQQMRSLNEYSKEYVMFHQEL